MEYRWVKGFRKGSNLVYMTNQKMLYVSKIERNGAREYICHQTVLSAPKKKGGQGNHPSCTARIRILPDGTCEEMSQHECHGNHETILQDMDKFNNMKRKSQTLKEDHEEDAHRIPARHIYQREIAK